MSTSRFIQFIFMGILFATSFFSYCSAASEAQVVDALYERSSDPGQIKILIDKYCEAVFSSPSFIKNGFVYDARYSSFVYLLCSNVANASKSLLKDTYFKRKIFAESVFTNSIDTEKQYDRCAPKTMDNDCDLATNIPKLFNLIMNDYINIMQFRVYSFLATFPGDDQSLGAKLNEQYFAPYFGIEVCNRSDGRYKKTCRMVKNYVKANRNILTDLYLLDKNAILNLPPCDGSGLFVCGLTNFTGTMTSFINLAYNELFYYRLFMGYYLTMLQKFPYLVSSYASIYKRFTTEYLRSKNAMSLSFRMIRDMYVAYPLHVGFSMYEEDLDGLGKRVARIVTPIYLLYDKLRNVQKPQ